MNKLIRGRYSNLKINKFYPKKNNKQKKERSKRDKEMKKDIEKDIQIEDSKTV